MPRGIRCVGFHEVVGKLVVARIGGEVRLHVVLYEGGGVGDHPVRGNGDALVVAIEEVEGFGDEVEFVALAEAQGASDAQVRGGVVGSGEGIAAVAGKTVVQAVRVLIGIAGDGGVEGASGTVVDDRGEPPVIEDMTEKFVAAMEKMRLDGEGGDQALALVGDAGSALSARHVGILNGRRLSGDESVLAVVDGTGVCIRKPQIRSAGDAAIDR